MKKTFIKILSVVLCSVMVLGAAPLSGLVGLELPGLFDFKAEAATYSGECGTNLTWSLDTSTGVLNITGTGAMTNWSYNDNSYDVSTPWYKYSSYIKTVNIASDVTTIGDWAFAYCGNLTSVTVPDSVTTIGASAFYECTSLTSITIGNGITTIGESAFAWCVSLTDVYYNGTPEQWIKISIGSGNTDLTSAAINLKDSAYSSACGDNLIWILDPETGVLNISGTGEMWNYYYNPTDNSEPAPWFDYCSDVKTVNVGNGITTIGDDSFCNCTNLTSVTIPDSVTTIGEDAFYNCTSLTNITIPDSVTTIGERALYNCTSLTSVTIGNSVTTIGEDAFHNCTSLTDIYYNGTQEQWDNISIGSDNSPLTSATIHYETSDYSGMCGDNLTWTLDTSTGVLNITGKGEMTDWTYESPAPWYLYRDYIKTVNISNGVITIGDNAFCYCTNLTSVSIPESVCCIGYASFESCENLENIALPENLQYIYEFAFWKCSSLATVSIPASVMFIGNAAFADCYSLKTITVDSENQYYSSDDTGALYNKEKTTLYQYPIGNTAKTYNISSTVSVIDERVFACAEYLETVYIPVGVSSVGYAAFYDCKNLLDIYYDGTQIQWNEISIDDGNYSFDTATIHFKDVDYSGICGDNLTWTFDPETGVLNITGTGAMYNWSSPFDIPWYSYSSYIKTVNISSGVTTIGERAFCGCNITNITIGNSVTTIGESAFASCTSLTSVTIPNSVTTIGHGAFSNCTSLASVIIGNGVTTIGDYAFSSCDGLTSVTIGNSVTSIGDYAFYSCDSLTSVTIGNSVTTIGDYAFYCCTNLTSVTIGSSVTTIGDCAFHTCHSLTSITIPDNVTTIGDAAFSYCTSLASVIIGNGVTTIGEGAFNWCTGLTSITIPDSVTSIGDLAFHLCYNLTSITVDSNNKNYSSDSYGVLFSKDKTILIKYPAGNSRTSYTIPDSVISIGYDAFENSDRLISVTIPDSVKTIDGTVFYGCNSLTSVTVDKRNENYSSDSFGVLFNKDKKTLIQYPIGNTRTSYVLPDSVTSIGAYAFEYCTSLTSITIPDNVTTIGYLAFGGCTSLTDVYYTGTEAQWKKIAIDSYNDPLENATIHYNHIHKLNNVIESVDPTCTETGYKTGTCVCGYIFTEEIPALNHKDTLVKVAAKAPTCTEIGWDAYEYCTACTYTTYAEKAALKHYIIIDKAVDATCTETGLTEGQHCSRCDDATIKQEVVPVKPHNYTAKYDSAKHWEECNCGAKANVQNHTFVVGNVCACGFKRTVDSTIKIKNNSGAKTINYGETLKLMATVTDKPENTKIYWYVDGEQKGEGEIFEVKFESGTKIITVKLVDENGVVYQNANGEEISESENVTVNAGFFQKLISFFKNLFRMNRTVVQ